MSPDESSGLINLPTAARLAGISEVAVCRMHRLGLFPRCFYVEVGGVRLVAFRRSMIENWIADGRPRCREGRSADWTINLPEEGNR